MLVEFPIAELAQRLLVQNRDLAPLVRIVEPLRVHMIELAFVEGRAPRLRQGAAFCVGLNALNVGPSLGKIEQWCMEIDERSHRSGATPRQARRSSGVCSA